MKPLQLFIFLLLVSLSDAAQKNIRLSSPDGQIVFSFRVTDTSALYNVSFKNKPIITNSPISLNFLETGEFKKNLKPGKPIFREGEENYELITGKSKWVRQPYREVLIPLEELTAPFRKINFVARAF